MGEEVFNPGGDHGAYVCQWLENVVGAPAPEIWQNFLDGLLHAEDIPTLQEFIGYCLIPSNKAS